MPPTSALAPSSSGLGRSPLKAEIAGSNPAGATRTSVPSRTRPLVRSVRRLLASARAWLTGMLNTPIIDSDSSTQIRIEEGNDGKADDVPRRGDGLPGSVQG